MTAPVIASAAKQSPHRSTTEGVASSPLNRLGAPRNDTAGTAGFSPASLLTRAELLDHARHPRNRGELPDADIVQTEDNPLCGDVVTIYAKIDPTSDKLQATSFVGSGCIISQAAASMLSEHVVGKVLADIERMKRADIEALLGATVSPSRVKCAMLPLVALKKGLLSLRGAAAPKQSPEIAGQHDEITSLRSQ